MTKTKEAYKEFLKSDFWIALTAQKKSMIGRCEKCSSTDRLESHHKFYRANWYHTLLDDLEVLCRECHQEHHSCPRTSRKPKKHRRHQQKSHRPKRSGRHAPLSKKQKRKMARKMQGLIQKRGGYKGMGVNEALRVIQNWAKNRTNTYT